MQYETLALAAVEDDDDKPLPDKSGKNLFNPTQRALRRELSSDRPDKTKSLYALYAGLLIALNVWLLVPILFG